MSYIEFWRRLDGNFLVIRDSLPKQRLIGTTKKPTCVPSTTMDVPTDTGMSMRKYEVKKAG